MSTFTVPADHIEAISREVATGITKAESDYAGIDAQHSLFWDQTVASAKVITDAGGAIDIVHEVARPLMNDDYDDADVPPAPDQPYQHDPSTGEPAESIEEGAAGV